MGKKDHTKKNKKHKIDEKDRSLSSSNQIQKPIKKNSKNINDMEVHVKPKENKEFKLNMFLYEFFIIFLAVSLSFIVENIRERYIEHHKEVQYINSLINDIKIDTLQLNKVINDNKKQIIGIDSLLRILEKSNSIKIVNPIYHYTIFYMGTLSNFSHTDRTIVQLKNAGGLRLIQSKAASDSIVSYDGLVQDVEQNGEICLKSFYDILNLEKELLNFKVLRTTNFHKLLSNPDLKLLNNDPKKIDQYYNETLFYMALLNGYKIKLETLKGRATQLLKTLKSEYDIDD